MVRKRGKLPGSVVSHAYSLEYGMDSIEISADLIEPGSRVVVIDDLIATGGTAAATVELLRKIGAQPVAAAFLIELTFLHGRAKLDVPVEALLQYESSSSTQGTNCSFRIRSSRLCSGSNSRVSVMARSSQIRTSITSRISV